MSSTRAITRRSLGLFAGAAALASPLGGPARAAEGGKRLAYLTPGLDLPFWRVLAKGIEDTAKASGGTSTTYDSHNSAQTQLQNAQDAIAKQVDGIIISPTDSSTAPPCSTAAARARIPVVIADIGTTGGDYVSFIISDNEKGAYGVGQALAAAMEAKGWQGGTVGLVTISLARNNGKARTNGFMKAMDEAGIKQAALSQMQTYTADETFKFVQDMVTAHPDMSGLFVETDQPALGALRALRAGAARTTCCSPPSTASPSSSLIEQGEIVALRDAAALPDGPASAQAMLDHFAGKTPEKQILVPILVVDQREREAAWGRPSRRRCSASRRAAAVAPLLALRGIGKRFGGTAALTDAASSCSPARSTRSWAPTARASSTLSRVISGHIRPDEGEILLDGVPVRHASSRAAIRSGIAMVAQETSLAPDLSVLENIMLPRLGMPGRPRWRRLARAGAGAGRRARAGGGPAARRRGGRAQHRPAPARRDPEGARAGQPHPDPRRADRAPLAARERAPVRDHAPARGAGTGADLRLAPARGDLRASPTA